MGPNESDCSWTVTPEILMHAAEVPCFGRDLHSNRFPQASALLGAVVSSLAGANQNELNNWQSCYRRGGTPRARDLRDSVRR